MLSVTIQMKATEQYFPVVLFTMVYTEVLICQSVDEQECKSFYRTFPFPPRLTDQRLYISVPALCSLSCKGTNKQTNKTVNM